MAISGGLIVSRISSEIDKKGLKRTDLYEIVPSGTLSNWKNKGQEPSAYTLYKVAVFLGVSVDWILTGKDSSGLAQDEINLLSKYRQLEHKDKDEIIGIIELKIGNSKKGDISSNTAAG
jgi:transcriptional regulator with XRE-family HTH domain